MAQQSTSIEMNVPADQVNAAVSSVCAEWGVEQAEVDVDIQPTAASGTVRVVITLHDSGEAGENLDDDDDVSEYMHTGAASSADDEPPATGDRAGDPELSQARQRLMELLTRMNVKADIDAAWGETDPDTGERAIVLDVRGDDLGMLIGRKGETLAALQYMTRLILSKQSGTGVDVVVDVQGHKRRREEQVRRMARRMADQAAQRQRTMTLEPMPANERRLVHIELRSHPAVRTESVGEGHARKVTIIPK